MKQFGKKEPLRGTYLVLIVGISMCVGMAAGQIMYQNASIGLGFGTGFGLTAGTLVEMWMIKKK